MPKLLRVSGREVIRPLRKTGFSKASQRGSHIKLKRVIKGGRQMVIIPNKKIILNR